MNNCLWTELWTPFCCWLHYLNLWIVPTVYGRYRLIWEISTYQRDTGTIQVHFFKGAYHALGSFLLVSRHHGQMSQIPFTHWRKLNSPVSCKPNVSNWAHSARRTQNSGNFCVKITTLISGSSAPWWWWVLLLSLIKATQSRELIR